MRLLHLIDTFLAESATIRKDVKAIRKEAQRQGWTEQEGGKNYILTPPCNCSAVIVSKTPSAQSAIQEILRDLRQRGFIWPAPRKAPDEITCPQCGEKEVIDPVEVYEKNFEARHAPWYARAYSTGNTARAEIWVPGADDEEIAIWEKSIMNLQIANGWDWDITFVNDDQAEKTGKWGVEAFLAKEGEMHFWGWMGSVQGGVRCSEHTAQDNYHDTVAVSEMIRLFFAAGGSLTNQQAEGLGRYIDDLWAGD